MKVKMLETVKDGREEYAKGLVVTVDNEFGAYLCLAGWAEDITGAVRSGERFTDEVVLEPHRVVFGTKSNVIT